MDNPPSGWQQPGSNPGWQQPGPPPAAGHQPAQTNGKAIAALILGIAGCCFIGFIGGIAAIILGVMARKEIDANPGMYEGRGMATAGLVLGIIGTVGSVLFLIFYAVGIFALLAECDENPDSELCQDAEPAFEEGLLDVHAPAAPVSAAVPLFAMVPARRLMHG